MKVMWRPVAILPAGLVACIAVTAVGCFGIKGPDRPAFDPAGSAAQAIEIYDANSDGAIDESEVEGSPGLREAFAHTDKDGDGKVTAEELEARITYYKSAPTTIVQGQTRVTYKGRPLEGATVTFEPESFLGDAFTTCSGETDYDGLASIKGHDEEFPGIYLGFYRVRISQVVNGKEKIPAKYNEETELGYEATDDLNEGLASIIEFKLK